MERGLGLGEGLGVLTTTKMRGMMAPPRVEAKVPKVQLGLEEVELLEEPPLSPPLSWILAWVGHYLGSECALHCDSTSHITWVVE